MSNLSLGLALAVALVTLMFSSFQECFHRIEEGNLGLYWRFGCLTSRVTTPGFHYMMPYATVYAQVPTVMQTEMIFDVPCGTSGGVILHFQEISIVYRTHAHLLVDMVKNYSLDYTQLWLQDPVPHEMNQICTKFNLHEIFITKFADLDEMLKMNLQKRLNEWCPALQVISVRLTKPSIPESIQSYFGDLSNIASQLKIIEERQITTLRSAEKDRSLAIIQAEKDATIAKMRSQRHLSDAERQVAISNVTTVTECVSLQEQANAVYYAKLREAQANHYRLTAEFLNFQRTQMLSGNTEYFWGNRLPTAISSDGATLDDATNIAVLRTSRGKVE